MQGELAACTGRLEGRGAPPERTAPRSLRPSRGVVLLLTVVALVAAAGCSDSTTTSGTSSGTDPSGTAPPATAAPAAPVDFSERGPYDVGTTRVPVGDTEALVFYPADPDALGTSPVTSYSSGEAFTPELRDLVAGIVPEFVQDIPLDAWADAGVSPQGPFPVVLHSHGFGGSYLFASQHLEHLASWGFVAVAPDHRSRNLAAVASGQIVTEGQPDVVDLGATLDQLAVVNATDGAVLEGSMDLDEVAAEGHSAGGRAAMVLALEDDRIDGVVGQAPGAPVRLDQSESQLSADERAARTATALAEVEPPDIPSMLIAGERDQVIPLAPIEAEYDWLQPPKWLIVLANAGHNAFTDTCAPITSQGGLEKYESQLPQLGPLLRLGGDGCGPGYLEPAQGYALTNHSEVAFYRWLFGQDPTTVSLSPEYLADQFPEAFSSALSRQSP